MTGTETTKKRIRPVRLIEVCEGETVKEYSLRK